MDEVMTFKTRVTDATLNVTRDGKTDTKTLRIWNRGWDDSYSEFLSPARDKGVKYLKLEKNLYMFLPSTEKVVKISGHLLRQSVMDSDFSYEDMLEQRALLQDYDAKLLGADTLDGKPCWVVDLTAKNPGQTYARRKMWIAQDTLHPAEGRALRPERPAAQDPDHERRDGRRWPQVPPAHAHAGRRAQGQPERVQDGEHAVRPDPPR
jgi:hypothetical protein